MVYDPLKELCMATLRKLRLPFFIVATAILLAAVYSWASESLTLSCSVPSIIGLNTPAVEEKVLSQDEQLQQKQAAVKTLYSR